MASHDRAVTVFSPDGQLLQVQYAQEATNRGSPAIGIRGPNIIVLAVEKRTVEKLQVDRTEKKIVALDNHVILTFAGWRADARVLITRAQVECQSYRLAVEDSVSVGYISRYIAELKQNYTQSNGKRPFGVSCLVGGFDYDGSPHLFQTEPSGVYYEWKAAATGRHNKMAREFLENTYNERLVSDDTGAIKLAVRTLIEVVQSGQRYIEVAVLKRGQPMSLLDPEIVQSIVADIDSERLGE